MPNIRKIWKIVFATLLDPVAIPSPFLGSSQISNISCNFLPAGEERVWPDHVRGQPDHRRGGHGRRQERARQHRGAVRRRDALDANKYGFTIQPKTHRIHNIMATLSFYRSEAQRQAIAVFHVRGAQGLCPRLLTLTALLYLYMYIMFNCMMLSCKCDIMIL